MRRLHLSIAVLGLATVLAACSHNDDDDRGHEQTPPPVAETPNPPPVTDAFVTYVAQQIATADETSEPASIDGVTVTTPETTEPLPVPGT